MYNNLNPMTIEVMPVNDRIVRLRIRYSLGVISLVSVYAPTEVSDICRARVCGCSVPQAKYASTGTDRDGYETCVGPLGSGTVKQNSTKFLDIATSHGFRVAGSWFQRPSVHLWTWCSNTGSVVKEIDHMSIDGHWGML